MECRTYTHARRHPLVIGKVGGWALPTPVTPTQLAVGVASFLALLYTRSAWAHLSGPVNLVVHACLPLCVMWMARHLRVEGRTPLRAAIGWLTYAFSPRAGLWHGRPHRHRTARARGRVFVACNLGSEG